MIDVRILLLSAMTLVGAADRSVAGPCTAEVGQLQARADARLHAKANGGPWMTETVGAKLHHQPTPASIAGAEQRLGEGAGFDNALAALRRARALDQAGDAPACQHAVAKVRAALR
jgi:hypothetical protein